MNEMSATMEFHAAREAADTAGQRGRDVLPLEVSGLRFCAGGRDLVDVEALRLCAGAPSLVIGPNGAGKSLLLRLLHGLLEPAHGKVLWNGREADETIRAAQAMVFQRPVLLRRSVLANVEYALRTHGVERPRRREVALDWLRRAGLDGLARQPARTLSGGEQQRLALARALALDPDVLFLDEPTASLDPVSTHAIETLIGEAVRHGTKIIMVTHDLGQIRRLGGEVLFMNRGRIAEQAPAETFLRQPGCEEARAFMAGGLVM